MKKADDRLQDCFGVELVVRDVGEDITGRLTRYRHLTVIGEHSAAAFRSENPDFAAIREKLSSSNPNSVRRAANAARHDESCA